MACQVSRARLHEDARFFIFLCQIGARGKARVGAWVIWDGLGVVWDSIWGVLGRSGKV